MSIKQLAKLAYEHTKLTDSPLETQFEVRYKDFNRLIVEFEKVLNKGRETFDIAVLELYSDGTASISNTDSIFLEFRWKIA